MKKVHQYLKKWESDLEKSPSDNQKVLTGY